MEEEIIFTTEHTESTEKLTAKSAKSAKKLEGFLRDLRVLGGSKKNLCELSALSGE